MKISFLMLTRNRWDHARRAVSCFQQQRYPDVELVVVDNGSDGTSERIEQLKDMRIRCVRVDEGRLSIGALRNISVQNATGELVAVFDDDDWHHPDRAAAQAEYLIHEGADLCMLDRVILAYPTKGLFAISDRRHWQGTLLAKKASLPPYPDMGRGQDVVMVNTAIARGSRACFLPRPDLYIYVHHPLNVTGDAHFRWLFDLRSRDLEAKEVEWVKAALAGSWEQVQPWPGRQAE